MAKKALRKVPYSRGPVYLAPHLGLVYSEQVAFEPMFYYKLPLAQGPSKQTLYCTVGGLFNWLQNGEDL